MTKYFQSQEAFENLFKEYFNPLVNYINRYIKDWEASREIVQTTFLKIWRNKEELDIHTSVNSYLYQIAKNGMIDHIRKNQTFQKKMENYKTTYEDLHKEENGLDPFIIKQAIYEAMQKLKPKNRKIFELNKFEGLTYYEIATHLEISERSVEDNISRAMKLLREELKDHPVLF